MPGALDPVYVKAREILLDALEALGAHRRSLVLVGAQAIYIHTGEADLAVAPYTTDADLVIDPQNLAERPEVGASLAASGFVAGDQPGQWVKEGVRVDLMVPEAVAGPGRRGVRLGPHGNRAARKARGLEGALVDAQAREVASFADAARRVDVMVAGPASLLVSKLHKLAERRDEPGRLKDKDALDVLRILRRFRRASSSSAFDVYRRIPARAKSRPRRSGILGRSSEPRMLLDRASRRVPWRASSRTRVSALLAPRSPTTFSTR